MQLLHDASAGPLTGAAWVGPFGNKTENNVFQTQVRQEAKLLGCGLIGVGADDFDYELVPRTIEHY